MGRPKSKASREEILAVFHTDEPFKAAATRLGMSPNTLRVIWKEAFGEDAFSSRGKKLQSAAATETARGLAANRVYKDVPVRCAKCGGEVLLKANQVAQMEDAGAFVCDDCQGDRACSVCGLRVEGERGLSGHFRHRRDAGDQAHLDYRVGEENARWASKAEGEDFVACLVCGHRSRSLIQHLKAAHSLTAEEYRSRYGQVQVLSQKAAENRQEAIKAGRTSSAYEGTKMVLCPLCGVEHEVHKLSAALPCPGCKSGEEAARWEGLSEPEDFVTCLDCGYRAENLTSHIQNAHPNYRVEHQGAPVVALRSAVRDKTALRGLRRSAGFRRKIREAKLLGLTLESFQPFLEPDGTVDQRAMMRVVGCAWPALRGYMNALGLKATTKYIEQSQEARKVTLTAPDLEKHKLGNGKVSIARAASKMGRCGITIKKECRRLGLVWAHGNISQRKCLDALSEALGGVPFQEEWRSWRFVNPPTGHRFRFDGYFPSIGLVVEFQGWFHTTFPNAYMPDESYRSEWDKLVERDRIKREMITAAPDLLYLEVLESEPFTDVNYLQGRLVSMGILEVREGGLWLGDRLVRTGE